MKRIKKALVATAATLAFSGLTVGTASAQLPIPLPTPPSVAGTPGLGGVPGQSQGTNGGSQTVQGSVPVTLNAKNNSGISGTATYGTNSVTGQATGMDPNTDYYSFVYGPGSDANGPNPCILTGEIGAGPIATVGKWTVDANGNGTLNGTPPVPANMAGSMSIRQDILNTNGDAGPTPADTLVACGDVGPDQNTPLGNVQNQLPQLPPLPVPPVPGPGLPGVTNGGVPNPLGNLPTNNLGN